MICRNLAAPKHFRYASALQCFIQCYPQSPNPHTSNAILNHRILQLMLSSITESSNQCYPQSPNPPTNAILNHRILI
ncbi:hypothetical protein TNCT_555031 [Trichonephila clavata]|uniref:Uncharacterized protein n=1 Tax=Trichonephila clavata TaxID=2740835 RepID=A0A8X6FUD4_TRICU|nr:hypothetical protein TNCT_555031 [Trichonephila clavata]